MTNIVTPQDNNPKSSKIEAIPACNYDYYVTVDASGNVTISPSSCPPNPSAHAGQTVYFSIYGGYSCYSYKNGLETSQLFGTSCMTSGITYTIQSCPLGLYCISTSTSPVTCTCGNLGDGTTGTINVGTELPCDDK